MLAPSAEMDVILRAEISAEPGLSLGFFLFQLLQECGTILGPEAVVVDMAAVGRKQGLRCLLRPICDGRSPVR